MRPRGGGRPQKNRIRSEADEKRGTSCPVAFGPFKPASLSLSLSLGTKMTLDKNIKSSVGKGLSLGQEPGWEPLPW